MLAPLWAKDSRSSANAMLQHVLLVFATTQETMAIQVHAGTCGGVRVQAACLCTASWPWTRRKLHAGAAEREGAAYIWVRVVAT